MEHNTNKTLDATEHPKTHATRDEKPKKKCLKSKPDLRSWNGLAKKHAMKLLKNEDVRRWYENMYRSSKLNAYVRIRRLNLFCDRVGTTPEKLVEVGRKNPMDAENILLDHVTWMEGQKYAPGYIISVITAIKAWLVYNHVEIKRKIRVTNADIPVTIRDEKVPDHDQLRQILNSSTPRCRAIISMIAFAGIRPQVMGLADRSDGLRLADLPDLKIDGENVSMSRTPAMVVVKQELSKTRNKYITFLTEEGCEYVLGYLQQRISRGEVLKPDSALIAVNFGRRLMGWRKLNPQSGQFLVTNAISSSIRGVIWPVIKMRPYALRAYFDTQLLLAESHGCMPHAYRQFFMGHKGDMESKYTTNKGRLPDQMIDDMRRSFAQSQIFLATRTDENSEHNKKEMLLGMWRQQAGMYGLDPDAMLQGAGSGAGSDGSPREPAVPDGAGLPEGSEGDDPAGVGPGTEGRSAYETRIARGEEELLAAAAKGWDLVKDMSGDRFLIRRKTGQPDAS